MKLPTGIKLLFLLLLPFLLTGCGSAEKKQVKSAVVSGFDQLKDLDPDTVQEYLASESLFPNATTSQASAEIVEETTTRFFKDFDYDIQKIHVRGDTATCSLQLTTLDAAALARDYQKEDLIQVIMAAANGQASADTSLQQHYTLLNELLQKNTYNTTSSSCDIFLLRTDGKWVIQKNRDLENQLVGGFLSVIANPYLITPPETLDIYFQTLKGMDIAQMTTYLGLNDILTYSDDTSQALAEALLEQLHSCFNYRVAGSQDNGTIATVNTEITSFSSTEILSQYNAQLKEYLNTSDALIAGPQGRLEKSNELLLKSIQDNTATQSKSVSLSMINDGISWKLQSSSQLGEALFGDFTSNVDNPTLSSGNLDNPATSNNSE